MAQNVMDRLLSHRLRGFSFHEGSLSALRAGLSAGVRNIEIDTRVTADGQVLVYHESRLDRITNRSGRVADYDVARSGRPAFRGGPDEIVPTLEEFVAAFAHARHHATLFIDVKDGGAEQHHCDILEQGGLIDDARIISWSPDILLQVHRIRPDLRLGFSHVPLTRWKRLVTNLAPTVERLGALRIIGHLTASVGLGHSLRDVYLEVHSSGEPPARRIPSVGAFPIHILSDLPGGALGAALRMSRGSVGVPSLLLTRDYVERAHGAGLDVFVFTLDSRAEVRRVLRDSAPDIIFTDNPELFAVGPWKEGQPHDRVSRNG